MKSIIALLAGFFLVSPSMALDVDAAKSSFQWKGKKVTGEHYGQLPLKSSKVKEAKGKIVGGEFVLDLNKMTVDDLNGEFQKKFLAHIKSKDFFEVSKWPTARLVIERMDGKKAYGQLTIKDKTHPVQFAYKQKGKVYSGQLSFDRTKFGMVYGSGNFFKNLGDKMIYNDVTLDFSVTLKDAPQKLSAN